MQLRHAARTDAGKTRDHNEDSYGVEMGGERAAAGALFVVCDGIGGFASGEVASDLAVKTIIARYYGSDKRDVAAALSSAFEITNQVVFEQGGGKMGTTGVAAVFRDDAVTFANVGDCRAYLIRDGNPRQITHDHSFVAEQVAAGILSEAQARESSYRNIITRAIGHRPTLEVDTFREALLNDDIVVLCSDGLHGQVSADEIALAVTKVPLDDACARLVKLANDRGGPDNITIVAVRVVELTPSAEPRDVSSAPAPQTASLGPSTSVSNASHGATERLQPVYGPPPAIERRKGDRRAAAPPVSVTPTTAAGNPLRSLLLYAVAALLLAALLFGGYFYFAVGGGRSTTPEASPVPRPTLTRTGDPTTSPAATPTLVPTTTTATP